VVGARDHWICVEAPPCGHAQASAARADYLTGAGKVLAPCQGLGACGHRVAAGMSSIRGPGH
jgi:hypothetical protein